MKKCMRGASACVLTLYMLSCTEKECDRNRMMSVVADEIEKSDRDINDYQLAEIKNEGKTVYLGMAAKMAPLYRRHYTINSDTCEIIDLKIDQ